MEHITSPVTLLLVFSAGVFVAGFVVSWAGYLVEVPWMIVVGFCAMVVGGLTLVAFAIAGVGGAASEAASVVSCGITRVDLPGAQPASCVMP